MSENNRNRSSQGSDENWNQHQGGRYDQQHQFNQQQGQYGQERRYGQQGQYGNSGNVNYGENDQYRNQGGYGSSGSGQYDRGRQGYENDYNQQNQGGSSGYGNYGASYSHNRESDFTQYGQARQSGQYGRRDEGSGYGNQYGGQSGNYGSSYGTSGGYGSYGGSRNYRDYESGYGNTSGNYGSGYGSSERGNWGNRGYIDHNSRDERGWWDKTRDEVSSWFGDEDAERRRRMDHLTSHKGKGPRDYRRSDDRILEDACDRLSDDSFVDASDIDVKVSGSEVILTGTVESREAKRRAEDIVESISGVSNVQNNLKVNPRSDSNDWRTTGLGRKKD